MSRTFGSPNEASREFVAPRLEVAMRIEDTPVAVVHVPVHRLASFQQLREHVASDAVNTWMHEGKEARLENHNSRVHQSRVRSSGYLRRSTRWRARVVVAGIVAAEEAPNAATRVDGDVVIAQRVRIGAQHHRCNRAAAPAMKCNDVAQH